MRLSYGTRISSLIGVVVALTLLSGLGALLTSWQMQRLMDATAVEHLPNVLAVNELRSTLLKQRGLVGSYFLDKRPAWIYDLDRLKPEFARWLDQARKTARTDEEHRILNQLAEAYALYDAEREHSITLFESGQVDAARQMLLGEVSVLASQVDDLCRELATLNQSHIDRALREGHERVAYLTLILTLCMGATLIFGAILLVVVLRNVLLPVRRLAEDTRALAASPGAAPEAFPDEMRELEYYSRALMGDVSVTRTSLEASRQRLLTAEKLAAAGSFAARAAHEIRSPLTSMRMWLYQLKSQAAADPAIERPCLVLEQELRRLEDMATSFLQFSRTPDLKLEPSDISEIVASTLELADHRIREKGVVAEHVDGIVLPRVNADRDQLRQVLLNLVMNAVDVTPAGGRLRVIEGLEAGEGGAPEVVVRVEDGGHGVPDAIRARLFEPFVTTKPQGTGLGLSIASNIMAQHHGSLVLESSSEQGSVFAMRVPAPSKVAHG